MLKIKNINLTNILGISKTQKVNDHDQLETKQQNDLDINELYEEKGILFLQLFVI